MKPYIRKFKSGRMHPGLPDRVLITLDCGHTATLTYEQAKDCGEKNQYLCFDCGRAEPSPDVPSVPDSGLIGLRSDEWNEDYLNISQGMRYVIENLLDRLMAEEDMTWEQEHERAWKLTNLIERMEGTENRIYGRFFEDPEFEMWDEDEDE